MHLRNRLARLFRGALPVWYHPDYRIPLASFEARTSAEPRRADFVAWYLVEVGLLSKEDLRSPKVAPLDDVARIHTPTLMSTLDDPAVLARIFGTDTAEVPVDALNRTIRLAVGGTIEAARVALQEKRATLNLLGGFHHAAPEKAGGACPVNDIAIAVGVLREEGFRGRVSVIDLDAHPPDGTAACFANDPNVWIGSISGSNWGDLPHVDETVLAPGAGDAAYHAALDALLARRPPSELVFVLAGGDVLANDRMGQLGLTLEGALERDRRVVEHLGATPSVWLPGGGYHPAAWRLFAGTAVLLATGHAEVVPVLDPLRARFAGIAATLDTTKLGAETEWFTPEEVDSLFGAGRGAHRLLGHYTASGVEYGLFAYGILEQIERLGYCHFRVVVDQGTLGDRMRVYGECGGVEHMLIESVVTRDRVADRPVLFIHWLNLRNPRATFSDKRPRLRGQDAPGLGLAREAGEMLARIAARVGLDGVAFRPMFIHSAWTARYDFRFIDPVREGQFEALVRDLRGTPLPAIDAALGEGRLTCNGEVWRWEPELMVAWLHPGPPDPRVAAVRASSHFRIVEGAPSV